MLLQWVTHNKEVKLNMKISTLMEKTIYRINEDSTVQKAAETMGKKHIGSLLVTKGEEIVGIITERDVMTKVIAEKRNLEVVDVKEVMSMPLVTVDKDTDGEEVIKLMAEKGVRKVLVTNKEEIIGIFSTSDVTKLAAM